MTAARSDLEALGPLGLWSGATEALSPDGARALAKRYDESAFPVVWLPEGLGHEVLTHAGLLLAATDRLVVATGIASIWARDAYAAHAGARLLRAAHDDRFVLGLGVSHRLVVDDLRGQSYGPPVGSLADYLDRLDAYDGSTGSIGPRVVAAIGPRMLDLAADRGAAVLTYLTTMDHTAKARLRLGNGHLSVQLPVVLGGAVAARATAREYLATYLVLDNYRRSFTRLGFTDADLDDGGSDRLVDALVAHGDLDDLRQAITSRREAGADHVALQPLDDTTMDALLGTDDGWCVPSPS